MEKRFALLIDADNVSAKYIKPIINELSQYGNITYKRIYGDWTNNQHSSWKEELLKNSISPIQQFSYTQGKNSTDSAMIIDAMDILYTNSVEGFCIVSSDSDFTRLASRLRETGLTVIGMGEEKTPIPFRKACDIFTKLELLVEEQISEEKTEKEIVHVTSGRKNEQHEQEESNTVIDKKVIEEAIVKIITENQNSDRQTSLGEIGNRLVKLYPEFDVRSYGYSLLSKFLEEFPKFQLLKRGNAITVMLQEDEGRVEEYIVNFVRKCGKEGIDLSLLGNKVHEKYANFKTRDYGYSQFNKYVKNISHLKVKHEDNSMTVYYQP